MIKLKVWLISLKAKKYWKNSFKDSSRYSLQFRNDYLVKKVTSLIKSLNIQIEVIGYDNLSSGPCFLYGNHQDNFDSLALIYALKSETEAKDNFNKIPTFIAKQSLQYRSHIRNILNLIDTFYLDRNDVRKSLKTFENYGKFVKDNKTFGVIFPEGTRNRESTVGEFKPGAFKVAIKEYIPIIPFTINNSVGALDLSRKEPLKVQVIFHKKIQPSSFVTQNTVALSNRVRSIVLSSFKEPQNKFKPSTIDDEDEEQTKYAIKWRKKEAKKLEKQAKIERRRRKEEQKIIDSQKKIEEKYEKLLIKKEQKKKNKK